MRTTEAMRDAAEMAYLTRVEVNRAVHTLTRAIHEAMSNEKDYHKLSALSLSLDKLEALAESLTTNGVIV